MEKMKQLLTFSVLLILLLACSRKKADFLGPAYISAGEGFDVTSFTATPSPVDFTLESVTLNATFTKSVTWKLAITGDKSGALYEVEGVSGGLENVLWKGNNSGVSFFRAGETATATLSFFGTSATWSTTITIKKVPNFTAYGQFPTWGDFENRRKINQANLWFPFGGVGVTWGVDSMAIDYSGNLVPSVQGKGYYFIKGLGTQPQFVSGIQSAALTTPLPATPDNIWVNMYIYGTGDANAGVELEYQEKDADGTDNSGSGYQGTDDDAFVTYITLSHKGWKLFSFKYSDLTITKNKEFGGCCGNRIHEPERLVSFDLILVKKTNPDAPIEVYFDYPIITVGGPFDPSK